MKRLLTLILVAMLSMSCTEREWLLMNGTDSSSYISATVTGTLYNCINERFTSDSGQFNDYYHPEFTMHDDGTFDFNLKRKLSSKNGHDIWLYFEWENLDGKITLDKVYSLKVVGDSRARITSSIVHADTLKEKTKEYNSTSGWIVFTSKRVYSGGMLYTGEFCFEAEAEDGTKVSVTNGHIIDCRICIADDYGCVAK